jgi:glycosyltransferase involved in cell wall biosynthesis
LGRIHPKKGLVNLLKAWKQAINSQPSTLNPWLLGIAGWDQGGHEEELKRLATELGLEWGDYRTTGPRDKGTLGLRDLGTKGPREQGTKGGEGRGPWSVVFLGPQFGEEKAACYQGCDAFILPSLSEGVPMVVLEAWAWRKPVLMTPQCNLPEGFAANAAICIEPGVESITQGLVELFRASPAALCALGNNGRELTARRYAWPHVADEMKRLYEWNLGGGARPACLADF